MVDRERTRPGCRRPASSRAIALAAGCMVACTVAAGRSGDLGFSYQGSDLAPEVLRAPLATGAIVDLVVHSPRDAHARPSVVEAGAPRFRTGEVEPVPVERAVSADPGVVEVVSVNGAHVRLRGVSVGRARITVLSRRGSDEIDIAVADPARVEIQHPAWAEPDVDPAGTALVSGGTAVLWLDRVAADGTRLAGYVADVEVAVVPEGAGRLSREPDALRHVRLHAGPPGKLSLEGLPVGAVSVDVVAPDEVAAIELAAVAPEPRRRAGAGWLVRTTATLQDGRRAIGLGGVLAVTSRTPSVCETVDLAKESGGRWFEALVGDGYVGVDALAPGRCELEAAIGSAIGRLALEVDADP
jgi:hypothetical protein